MENKLRWGIFSGLLVGIGMFFWVTASTNNAGSGLLCAVIPATAVGLIAFLIASEDKSQVQRPIATSPTLGKFMESGELDQQAVTVGGEDLYNKTVKVLSAQSTGAGIGLAGVLFGWVLVSMFSGIGLMGAIVLALGIIYVLSQGGGIVILVLLVITVVVVLVVRQLEGVPDSSRVRNDPVFRREREDEVIKQQGGRELVRSELQAIQDVLAALVERGGEYLKIPERYVVLPKPHLYDAYVMGEVVFLTDRLLKNPTYLAGALVHEIGRIQQNDGVIKLALRQLTAEVVENKRVLPFPDEWIVYWRQQVFKADEFAAEFGFADELLQYLRNYKEPLDAAQAYLFKEEPYIAERIARLEDALPYADYREVVDEDRLLPVAVDPTNEPDEDEVLIVDNGKTLSFEEEKQLIQNRFDQMTEQEQQAAGSFLWGSESERKIARKYLAKYLKP